ncbi:MAG: hypothetical protein PQJ59_12620 [Spirochaetales bacterium]|nr:hypothetical protein [Spirochaetales bacterium]
MKKYMLLLLGLMGMTLCYSQDSWLNSSSVSATATLTIIREKGLNLVKPNVYFTQLFLGEMRTKTYFKIEIPVGEQLVLCDNSYKTDDKVVYFIAEENQDYYVEVTDTLGLAILTGDEISEAKEALSKMTQLYPRSED